MTKKETRPRLSFADQILLAYRKAKRNKDPMAMAYYAGISAHTVACASWSQFKGSWAHSMWIQQPDVQSRIDAAKRILGLSRF